MASLDTALQQLITAVTERVGVKLLWTNASPASAFAAQTLTIADLSSYKDYIILYKFHTTETATLMESAEVGTGAIMNMCDAGNIYRRNVAYTTNKLTISDMRGAKISGAVDIADNKYLIPVKIYGVKFSGGVLG